MPVAAHHAEPAMQRAASSAPATAGKRGRHQATLQRPPPRPGWPGRAATARPWPPGPRQAAAVRRPRCRIGDPSASRRATPRSPCRPPVSGTPAELAEHGQACWPGDGHDRQNVLKLLTVTLRSPGPGPGSRTATQMIFLCTSIPATRGWTISIATSLLTPRTTETGTPPGSPQQDQNPVTRARSSNPGYSPGRLQRPSIGQAHSTKARRHQRAAPQVSPIRGRHDSDMGSIGRTGQTEACPHRCTSRPGDLLS